MGILNAVMLHYGSVDACGNLSATKDVRRTDAHRIVMQMADWIVHYVK